MISICIYQYVYISIYVCVHIYISVIDVGSFFCGIMKSYKIPCQYENPPILCDYITVPPASRTNAFTFS